MSNSTNIQLRIMEPKEHDKRNKAIIKWLKEHELITIRRLALMVNTNDTQILMAMSGDRKLPIKLIPKLEKVLKNYGFTNTFSNN